MKTLCFACSLICLMASVGLTAEKKPFVTQQNTVFCLTYPDTQRLDAYTQQGDKQAALAMIMGGDCAIVKPSIRVYVMGSKGNVVRVRREGMTGTLWTWRGALTSK